MAADSHDSKRMDLLRELEDFATMQREHAEALAAGRLQALMPWWQERQRAFERLRQSDLAQLAGSGDSDEAFVALVRGKVEALIRGEQELSRQATAQHQALAERICLARRGQKTLRQYRGQGRIGNQPAYLSSRM